MALKIGIRPAIATILVIASLLVIVNSNYLEAQQCLFEVKTKIDVFENDTALVIITLKPMDELNLSGYTFIMPVIPVSTPRSLWDAMIVSGEADLTVVNDTDFKSIFLVRVYSIEKELKISYKSDAYIYRFRKTISVYDDRYFSYVFYTPNLTACKVSIEVYLPKNSDLMEVHPTLPIYQPEPTTNMIDIWTGRRVLGWEDVVTKTFRCALTYRLGIGGLAPIIVIASVVVVASAISIIGYFIVKRMLKPKIPGISPGMEEGKPELNRDEEITLKVIARNGSVAQKDLPDLTGFSKAKVSRIVNRLVNLGLLSKSEHGRTYIIKLSDEASKLISTLNFNTAES